MKAKCMHMELLYFVSSNSFCNLAAIVSSFSSLRHVPFLEEAYSNTSSSRTEFAYADLEFKQ